MECTNGSCMSFYCQVVFHHLDIAINFLNEFSKLSRLNTLRLWLDVAPGPPIGTSVLGDVRGPSGLEDLGFWHLRPWPFPGTLSPPFLHFWLFLTCFVLCPQLSRLWAEPQRPCWWEVLALSMCASGLVSMRLHVCAWLCSALGGRGSQWCLKASLWGQKRVGRDWGSTGRWQVCSPSLITGTGVLPS